MYGKIMRWPDSLINMGFELCTRVSMDEVKKIINPRNAKARLAKEIVKIHYGEKKAISAEKEFERIFKEKKLPSEMPGFRLKPGVYNILDLLVKTKIAPSKSEAKRLVLQKGVKIDNEVQNDWQKQIEIKKGMIIQAGKRRFVKIF